MQRELEAEAPVDTGSVPVGLPGPTRTELLRDQAEPLAP